MRLNEAQVSEIRAAQELYRPIDVARHFDVHPSTVRRIWDGAVWADVPPALEPPNVISRPRPSELAEDIRLLSSERGMTATEVAEALGISVRSVYAFRGVLL